MREMANEENLKPFKKGEDPRREGNGRPKGSKNLKTLIEQVWNEEITTSDGNKKIQGLLAVKALIDKAKDGDVSAFRELADRMEGKPSQEVNKNIKGKATIEVVRPSYDKQDENKT